MVRGRSCFIIPGEGRSSFIDIDLDGSIEIVGYRRVSEGVRRSIYHGDGSLFRQEIRLPEECHGLVTNRTHAGRFPDNEGFNHFIVIHSANTLSDVTAPEGVYNWLGHPVALLDLPSPADQGIGYLPFPRGLMFLLNEEPYVAVSYNFEWEGSRALPNDLGRTQLSIHGMGGLTVYHENLEASFSGLVTIRGSRSDDLLVGGFGRLYRYSLSN